MLGECGRGAVQLASRSTVNVKFFDLESCKSGPPVREDDWRSMNVSDQIVDVAFALEEHDLVGIIGMRKRFVPLIVFRLSYLRMPTKPT